VQRNEFLISLMIQIIQIKEYVELKEYLWQVGLDFSIESLDCMQFKYDLLPFIKECHGQIDDDSNQIIKKAHDLLMKMLEINPKYRITVE